MTSPTTLGEAFIYYGTYLVVYALVAVAGVFMGVRLRKRKNEREGKQSS